jgi:hypothetical protein
VPVGGTGARGGEPEGSAEGSNGGSKIAPNLASNLASNLAPNLASNEVPMTVQEREEPDEVFDSMIPMDPHAQISHPRAIFQALQLSPNISLVRRCLQAPYGEGTLRDRVRKKVAIVDKKGRTPLHWAAMLGYCEAISLLLPSGAVVNATDNEGHTPLMYAAIRGHKGAVHLLLEHQADLTPLTVRGESALTHPSVGDEVKELLRRASQARVQALVRGTVSFADDEAAPVEDEVLELEPDVDISSETEDQKAQREARRVAKVARQAHRAALKAAAEAAELKKSNDFQTFYLVEICGNPPILSTRQLYEPPAESPTPPSDKQPGGGKPAPGEGKKAVLGPAAAGAGAGAARGGARPGKGLAHAAPGEPERKKDLVEAYREKKMNEKVSRLMKWNKLVDDTNKPSAGGTGTGTGLAKTGISVAHPGSAGPKPLNAQHPASQARSEVEPGAGAGAADEDDIDFETASVMPTRTPPAPPAPTAAGTAAGAPTDTPAGDESPAPPASAGADKGAYVYENHQYDPSMTDNKRGCRMC